MKSQRQLQIGENIKRVISDIFLREDILTNTQAYITILEADVSPDAKNVKIYIDIFGDEKNNKDILKALNKAAPHFRHMLAGRITLRSVPQIEFLLDKTQAKAMQLDSLIAQEEERFNKGKPKK